MDDIMSVVAPIMVILMGLLFVVGVACLHGYFIAGTFDGEEAGVDILIAGLIATLMGGGIFIGTIIFLIIAVITSISEKREKNLKHNK